MQIWVAICVFYVCSVGVVSIVCVMCVLYARCIIELVFFRLYSECKLENLIF